MLGEHAAYYSANKFFGTVGLFEDAFGSMFALSAGIERVCEIYSVCPFFAGETHFVRIDYYHIVATVGVGSECGFVFAAKQFCNACAETTKYLIGCVNHNPLFVCILFVDRNSLVT